MSRPRLLDLRERIINAGYGDEIVWSESLMPCDNAETFLWEYIWVVISAGMKNQIARKIFERVREALTETDSINGSFNHPSKVAAIYTMWLNYPKVFEAYQKTDDKLAFLKTLPWIGDITKYHLAKNLGMDIAKPDRHLARIAKENNTTPQQLCEELAKETGYRVATVDLIIWRAANLGYI